jgi:hypothetical protein
MRQRAGRTGEIDQHVACAEDGRDIGLNVHAGGAPAMRAGVGADRRAAALTAVEAVSGSAISSAEPELAR